MNSQLLFSWTVIAVVGVQAQVPSAGISARAETAQPATQNKNLNYWLFMICAGLAFVFFGYRVLLESVRYVRTLAGLSSDTQRYFSSPPQTYAFLKKHLIYAPMLRKRHNREFQISAAVNMGTLPTRLQALLLLMYFGTNVAFCVVLVQWSAPFVSVMKDLRNISGILAVNNMLPLFILSARTNPLISALGIPYDNFNLLHQWLGRTVILESLIHTGAWIAGEVQPKGDWAAVAELMRTKPLFIFGLIFKILHFVLAVLAVIGIWYHLKLANVQMQLNFLITATAIWGLEKVVRIGTVTYRNLGTDSCTAVVESLPGNAVRVTVDVVRPWTFKPGQHAYITIPGISWWQSHPFSVAWSEEVEKLDEKRGIPRSRQEILGFRKSKISFVVRARTGFTQKLSLKAETASEGRLITKCLVEGPYGGHNCMDSYGTVMLIAGGIGITHQVPFVRHLVAGFASGTVATRKLVLVWVIQSPEHLEWIRPWMTEILAMDKRREILRIMLFISRPRSTKEIHSPSATVQMFPGRPSIQTLLDIEIESQIGALGVSVCGSGALSDDVRQACRARQDAGNIDFIEEAFSW